MTNNLYTEIPSVEVFDRLLMKETIVGVEPMSYMIFDPIYEYEEGNIIITIAEYDITADDTSTPIVEHFRVKRDDELKAQITESTGTVFMTFAEFETIFGNLTDEDNLN